MLAILTSLSIFFYALWNMEFSPNYEWRPLSAPLGVAPLICFAYGVGLFLEGLSQVGQSLAQFFA
jgi:hypothetical protein